MSTRWEKLPTQEKEAFIKENSKWVGYLSKNFPEKADAYMDGMEKLIRCYERFDPSKGAKFRTFATEAVKGAMIDGSRKRIRKTINGKVFERSAFEKTRTDLRNELKREPSEDEFERRFISDNLSIDILSDQQKKVVRTEIREALLFQTLTISIDDDSGDDENEGFKCKIVDENPLPEVVAITNQNVRMLHECVEQLGGKFEVLIRLYYWKEFTLEQITPLLGLSMPALSQKLRKALDLLRKCLKKKDYTRTSNGGLNNVK